MLGIVVEISAIPVAPLWVLRIVLSQFLGLRVKYCCPLLRWELQKSGTA